eukprot:7028405-Ditylum_brightwellii.AAC.1
MSLAKEDADPAVAIAKIIPLHIILILIISIQIKLKYSPKTQFKNHRVYRMYFPFVYSKYKCFGWLWLKTRKLSKLSE